MTRSKKADQAKAKGKKNKNKKKKKKAKKASAAPDPTHPNLAPPALPAPPAAPPPPAASSSSSSLQLDAQYLDGHHRCVLAALLLAPQTLLASAVPLDGDVDGGRVPLCVVVGLGGGALPMALHRSLPQLRQWVAELDPDLIPVAQRWC